MKKLMSILLLGTMLFSFVGCGEKSTDISKEGEQQNQEQGIKAEKAKFILGLDDSFPPMGFRDENNEITGFDIDLAKAVCKKMDMELEIKPIDWSTKELELNSGKIDVIWNGLTVTPEREEAFLLSKPYLENNQIIVVRAEDKITDKSQLKDKTVAVQTGSSAEEALANDEISNVVTAKGYIDNVTALQDLKIGRVDAVVLDEVVARYYVTKSPELTILDDTLQSEVYAIAFKKDNTQLKDKLVKAFDEIIKDGTAGEISTKWFGKDVVLK